jgi:putative aldouronate transport system substrate-binding protein
MEEKIMKMRKLKRGLLFCAALVLFFAGCSQKPGAGGTAGSSAEPEKVVLRWLVPGSPLADYDRVMGAVNRKLKADGLQFELKVERIDWEVWDQKTNLMISTKEEFDVIHVMWNRLPFQDYAARGALMPIDEAILREHGPLLLESIDAATWDAARYNGAIYTIPGLWVDRAATSTTVARGDLFEKYGVPLPTNYEEFITRGAEVQAKMYADTGEKYYWLQTVDNPSVWSGYFDKDPGYPFALDSSTGMQLIKINKDKSTESFLESAAFKASCDYMRRAYQAGILMPDLLSIPRDTYMYNYIGQGRGLYSYEGYWERVNVTVPGAKTALLEFTRPRVVTIQDFFYNSNSISATSKHQKEVVQLFNWIQVKENAQLLCYGEKGVDWNPSPKGEKYYTPLKREGGYFFDMWEFLPYQFRMFEESTPETTVYAPKAETVSYSITAGFVFDPSAVRSEYTNLMAKYNEIVWPMLLGIISYDDNIAGILKEMRSVGLDKYMEEFNRQLKDWFVSKNK